MTGRIKSTCQLFNFVGGSKSKLKKKSKCKKKDAPDLMHAAYSLHFNIFAYNVKEQIY